MNYVVNQKIGNDPNLISNKSTYLIERCRYNVMENTFNNSYIFTKKTDSPASNNQSKQNINSRRV